MRKIGQTLATLLVVIFIIAIIITFVIFNRKTTTSGGQGQTTYGSAIRSAKGVECMNNLNQIRISLQQYSAENEANPSELKQLLPPGIQPVCPVTKSPYIYNPNTGTVKCPQHPTF